MLIILNPEYFVQTLVCQYYHKLGKHGPKNEP